MTHPDSPDWVPDETPAWFWKLIADANGNLERFRGLAEKLSREQLHEAYDLYRGLASCVTSSDLDEDEAVDIANWIVSQGKDYYFDVYEEEKPMPDEVPEDADVGFLAALGKVFRARFGVRIGNDKAGG